MNHTIVTGPPGPHGEDVYALCGWHGPEEQSQGTDCPECARIEAEVTPETEEEDL